MSGFFAGVKARLQRVRSFLPIVGFLAPLGTVKKAQVKGARTQLGLLPMSTMRLRERGRDSGGRQENSGRDCWAAVSCDSPMSSARRPPGESREAASGRLCENFSAARKVTTSAAGGQDFSRAWAA